MYQVTYVLRRDEICCQGENLHFLIFWSNIHQEMMVLQRSIYWWMNIENVEYMHYGILLIHKTVSCKAWLELAVILMELSKHTKTSVTWSHIQSLTNGDCTDLKSETWRYHCETADKAPAYNAGFFCLLCPAFWFKWAKQQMNQALGSLPLCGKS